MASSSTNDLMLAKLEKIDARLENITTRLHQLEIDLKFTHTMVDQRTRKLSKEIKDEGDDIIGRVIHYGVERRFNAVAVARFLSPALTLVGLAVAILLVNRYITF